MIGQVTGVRRAGAAEKILWMGLAAVPIFCAPLGAAASGTFNVRDHGAAGDGKTLDTAAINKAVAACAAAGGGQVLFPPGVYLSGTVHLTSNTIHTTERSLHLFYLREKVNEFELTRN